MKSDYALILSAASFAAYKHRGQSRKGAEATPYINHPLEVGRILAEEGGVDDAEVIAAALLHDTVEDTNTSADELRTLFGERITSMVLEVTDDKSLEKHVRKQLQIEHAPLKSTGASVIKLGDKIANVRDVGQRPPIHWDAVRRHDYLTWASSVVAGLPVKGHQLIDVFADAVATAKFHIPTPGL